MERIRQFIPWAGGTAADRPGGAYTCRSCGRSFDVQYYVCPECGGFSVEPGAADAGE